MFIAIDMKFNGPVVMAVRRSTFQENNSNSVLRMAADVCHCCISSLFKSRQSSKRENHIKTGVNAETQS
jgi:hypothetical protein